MKILAVSDAVVDWIYSPKIRITLSDVELAIGCGDLPQYYLDFIMSAMDIPVFFVYGNHSQHIEDRSENFHYSTGGVDLHNRVRRYKGFTFAGVEGSLRYRTGDYQYSQFGMWLNVFQLVPSLIMNRINTGNYLNVFISHAPPFGIQDQPDFPHQGIKAFLWLINQFHPDYHLHGHIHIYRPDMVTETLYQKTKVVNTFRYRIIEL
jgi:Icc-related predicted phosphoesterase